MKARRFVISAQMQLMRERHINEQDAYVAFRTLAMKRHVSLEQMCIDLVSNIRFDGCDAVHSAEEPSAKAGE